MSAVTKGLESLLPQFTTMPRLLSELRVLLSAIRADPSLLVSAHGSQSPRSAAGDVAPCVRQWASTCYEKFANERKGKKKKTQKRKKFTAIPPHLDCRLPGAEIGLSAFRSNLGRVPYPS